MSHVRRHYEGRDFNQLAFFPSATVTASMLKPKSILNVTVQYCNAVEMQMVATYRLWNYAPVEMHGWRIKF